MFKLMMNLKVFNLIQLDLRQSPPDQRTATNAVPLPTLATQQGKKADFARRLLYDICTHWANSR